MRVMISYFLNLRYCLHVKVLIHNSFLYVLCFFANCAFNTLVCSTSNSKIKEYTVQKLKHVFKQSATTILLLFTAKNLFSRLKTEKVLRSNILLQ